MAAVRYVPRLLGPAAAGLACIALAAVLLMGAAAGEDEVPAVAVDGRQGAVPARGALLAPTQGRPVFVEPGGRFAVTADLPPDAAGAGFELICQVPPAHRHALSAVDGPRAEGDGVSRRWIVSVPVEVPEETYDLKVSTPAGVLLGRHAVAVARIGRRIRLVHLSNMNIGDVAAPRPDGRLIAEVNLVAPTLIVATGDLLDATHEDPIAGWQELSDFLASFSAPTLLACGDHDNATLYSRLMAPSPIGVIDVGPYQGLVLYDLPGRPIASDAEQIAWVEGQLGRAGPTLRFVVSHDESPNLLRYWQQRGTLAEMVRAGRLGLWLAGGHRDWTGAEFRTLIDAAAPLMYLRSHQSSPALREGAEGVSHFRVVDCEGEQAVLYGPPGPGGLPGSIPVGRLKLTFEDPNDGTQPRVAFSAVNALPARMNHLAARVLVRRDGDRRPWCQGARLAALIDRGTLWECRVMFDLPDKGSLRAVVGTGPPPAEAALRVRFEMPSTLRLGPAAEAEGEGVLAAMDWAGTVRLENGGDEAVTVGPLLRLDGESLAYRVVGEAGPFALAYRVRLAPGQSVALQPDLSAVRVAPGRRELQVYVKAGLALVPVCWPLDVVAAD